MVEVRLKEAQNQEVVQASLYEEIGRLKMELDRITTAGLALPIPSTRSIP